MCGSGLERESKAAVGLFLLKQHFGRNAERKSKPKAPEQPLPSQALLQKVDAGLCVAHLRSHGCLSGMLLAVALFQERGCARLPVPVFPSKQRLRKGKREREPRKGADAPPQRNAMNTIA